MCIVQFVEIIHSVSEPAFVSLAMRLRQLASGGLVMATCHKKSHQLGMCSEYFMCSVQSMREHAHISKKNPIQTLRWLKQLFFGVVFCQ